MGIRIAGRLLPAWLCSLLGWLNFAVLFFMTSAVIFLFWKSKFRGVLSLFCEHATDGTSPF